MDPSLPPAASAPPDSNLLPFPNLLQNIPAPQEQNNVSKDDTKPSNTAELQGNVSPSTTTNSDTHYEEVEANSPPPEDFAAVPFGYPGNLPPPCTVQQLWMRAYIPFHGNPPQFGGTCYHCVNEGRQELAGLHHSSVCPFRFILSN